MAGFKVMSRREADIVSLVIFAVDDRERVSPVKTFFYLCNVYLSVSVPLE